MVNCQRQFENYAEQPTTNLINEISRLKDEISTLKEENKNLQERIAKMEAAVDIIDLRDISKDQAKGEIAAYFKEHDGENIYAFDIMEALRIEYGLVAEILEELEDEGKIKGT
jgi:hypothetical protein